MEPIFSIARQQPLGLKNGTQEKENNKEIGGVFPIEGMAPGFKSHKPNDIH